MPHLQMETEQVRQVRQLLTQLANSINSEHTSLTQSLQTLSASWQGGSSIQFADEMQTLLTQMQAETQRAEDLSQRLENEVLQWEEADARLGDGQLRDTGSHNDTSNRKVRVHNKYADWNSSSTRDLLHNDIKKREWELIKTLHLPEDSFLKNSGQTIDFILKPENRQIIEEMATRYGVDPALLAGIVASEMDFDYGIDDSLQDVLGYIGIETKGTVGISSVGEETLETAIEYLQDHNSPGFKWSQVYDFDIHNRTSDRGAIEGAAIVAAWLTNLHGGVNSAEDMAVVWGAYRRGIQDYSPNGGGYSLKGFQNNIANGTDNFKTEYKMGKNAYISQPYFEYFQEVFAQPYSPGH